MRSYLTIRNVIAALSGIVLIGFGLNSAARAITGGSFIYSTPRTGYLMIPNGAFVPMGDTVVYDTSDSFLTTTGAGCFMAGVNFPQGAKITQLVIWYRKSDASSASVSLTRFGPADSTELTLAGINPINTGGADKQQAFTITDTSTQTVDNAHFAYNVINCLSDQETFTGARIRYTYTSAGD